MVGGVMGGNNLNVTPGRRTAYPPKGWTAQHLLGDVSRRGPARTGTRLRGRGGTFQPRATGTPHDLGLRPPLSGEPGRPAAVTS